MQTIQHIKQGLADFWQELTREFHSSYRPELHYMRGPGPKWREEYGVAE